MPITWLEMIDRGHHLQGMDRDRLNRLIIVLTLWIYRKRLVSIEKEKGWPLNSWLLRRGKGSELFPLQKSQKVGSMESNWEGGTNDSSTSLCIPDKSQEINQISQELVSKFGAAVLLLCSSAVERTKRQKKSGGRSQYLTPAVQLVRLFSGLSGKIFQDLPSQF